jgi:segregation and condensation protein B
LSSDDPYICILILFFTDFRKSANLNNLARHTEALIFAANPSISLEEMKATLEEILGIAISLDEIIEAIEALKVRYSEDFYAFEPVEIAGGFRFMTKGAYHLTIGTFLKQNTQKKLSRSAMESLAIIAYRQPVTKAEIESIRGVNSDYTIQKLLEKDLIEITGRSEGPGKPLLYSTSQKFTDYFGLKSIADLPRLKEIEPVDHQIGEPMPIETQNPAEEKSVSEEENH